MQMTIFEALEKEATAKPKKTGLKHRWHIVRPYDDIADFVATVIPGKDEVHIMPGKHQSIIPFKKFDLTYSDYEKWLKKNGFEKREVPR